ncbi:nitroreductase [Rhodovulum imhoffii]|uniref:Putative NAD(P)H nitroreductase n=1 Tax=Rhodovulum imhoffii TaxID=365340 RepID=A0A2T5BT17_9RHOB|nr:nitroreductase family protein [Rhodovulum imhoffii]MBK5933817.1 nitroreductase [Rhodovulum imhoffii]PTN02538.1 nitroreductase [Rhodovulum imhoffii]
MPKYPEALSFLLNRRSRPAKTLAAPYPTRDDLRPILTAAARTPDHGKLVPWRFLVLERAALLRLGAQVQKRGEALGLETALTEKAAAAFSGSGLAVAVVFSPKISDKVPELDQLFSAGAACLQLLNAALAAGWGANWLSGWPAQDRPFLDDLGLSPQEQLAGFIHIGSETRTPPERPRPDIDDITTWIYE